MRNADTREQVKRKLNNWLFEAGGTYDRRRWKACRVNGLSHLLTLYHASHPLYTAKLKNNLRTTIITQLQIDICKLAITVF